MDIIFKKNVLGECPYSIKDCQFNKIIEIWMKDSKDGEFVVDCEIFIPWLYRRKDTLKRVIIQNFVQDRDYHVRIDKAQSGSGGHNKEVIFLTVDTFKSIAMSSKKSEGGKIRSYFIYIEKALKLLRTRDWEHIEQAEPEVQSLCKGLEEKLVELDGLKSNDDLETYYQKLAENLTGHSHSHNLYGDTDITTKDSHIEIKRWDKYKHALGQLLAYNMGDPRQQLKVFFFGTKPQQQNMDAIKILFNNYNIEVFCFNEDDTLHLL